MPVLPWLVSVFFLRGTGRSGVRVICTMIWVVHVSRNVLRISLCIAIWNLDHLISDISCIEYKLETRLFHYLKRNMAK